MAAVTVENQIVASPKLRTKQKKLRHTFESS